MFLRSIIVFMAVLFLLGSLTTGCNSNGKSAAQERQEQLIAKLNQEKQEKVAAEAAASTDYTFEQKADFLNEMKKDLAAIQEKMNLLSEKAKTSAKPEVQNAISSLKEEMEMAKQHIDETENSDVSIWEETKRVFRKAVNNLKESLAKTEKIVNDASSGK